MRCRDWFNINAIVAPICFLFTFTFGLSEAPIMSQQAEFLWIMGIIVITSLVWFNAAKTEQHGREARERDDKLTKLLEKPGTTLEDVRALVGDHAHFEGEVVDRERNGTVAK